MVLYHYHQVSRPDKSTIHQWALNCSHEYYRSLIRDVFVLTPAPSGAGRKTRLRSRLLACAIFKHLNRAMV